MRHNKKINHLGRTSAHRQAMLANMACSLIKHKRISTTLAKAKALQRYVEPLITKSKEANNETVTVVTKTVTVKHTKAAVVEQYGKESQVERKIHVRSSTAAHRLVFSYLKDNEAVKILFGEIAQKVADRPGGYTRIMKTGFRLGDAAEMCIIELVDYNENMLKEKTAKKKSTRRSARKATASDAKAAAPQVEEETAPIVEEEVDEIVEEETASIGEEDVAEEEVTAEDAAAEESAVPAEEETAPQEETVEEIPAEEETTEEKPVG